MGLVSRAGELSG